MKTLCCPRCQTELVRRFYKGMIEVDSCPECRGMWLDLDELDRLEDVVFDDDAHKGSLVHHLHAARCCCPQCGVEMQEFEYRMYDLHLDLCPERHGFWLDGGEDERVLEIMRQRAEQFNRHIGAEQEWRLLLKHIRLLLGQNRKK
jgi:Zn-finger nucleic acid-binding protein